MTIYHIVMIRYQIICKSHLTNEIYDSLSSVNEALFAIDTWCDENEIFLLIIFSDIDVNILYIKYVCGHNDRYFQINEIDFSFHQAIAIIEDVKNDLSDNG